MYWIWSRVKVPRRFRGAIAPRSIKNFRVDARILTKYSAVVVKFWLTLRFSKMTRGTLAQPGPVNEKMERHGE